MSFYGGFHYYRVPTRQVDHSRGALRSVKPWESYTERNFLELFHLQVEVDMVEADLLEDMEAPLPGAGMPGPGVVDRLPGAGVVDRLPGAGLEDSFPGAELEDMPGLQGGCRPGL